MYVVILAGGAGTRFWPLSRKKHPKQLMSVFGGKSMLQRTVERVLPLHPKRILIITNTVQAKETAEQLEYLKHVPIDIIEEPVGRNTAPAIGLAAAIIARHDPDAIMAVLPADHYIVNEEEFRATILRAKGAALNGYLITLGITPDRPETGYGYIEAEMALRGDGPYPVTRFVEKPFFEKALEFLTAGNFFWNSGMFVWQVPVILNGIKAHMPELHGSLMKLDFSADVWELADLKPQIAAIYGEIKGESIDYGVMEKAKNVEVIPADFGWSDVGSWRALPEVIAPDGAGNVLIDAGEAVNIDSRGCLAYGGGKLVALVGVENLIIVNTGDALMVCAEERAQEVKKVVEELERKGLQEYL
ncbi:MAG: mannose-1-phosphate [Geobacteraceae bacterium]|nr:MAG: mannose-1-phosphate [Geobacteraceae bacterium]